ncbi:hypothetical protein AN958_11687 [Leucoagaricus sp. SymC.cos]|nr:hypothetical protein AN958_11687 [Leucoagaricus sp. SymC.cos]
MQGDDLDLTFLRGSSREGEGYRDLALGLRSSRPPDSTSLGTSKSAKPEKTRKKDPKEDAELSDAEWEIRTGRALFVLQETLPEFFKIGLVTNVDKSTGVPVQSSSVLPLTLGPSVNPLDFLQQDSDAQDEPTEAGVESIYSPKIKLEYTPPSALPTPFPRTLHIEGFPLFLASASFMRHTMNALYSDLAVTLLKVSFNKLPSFPQKDLSCAGGLGKELQSRREKKRHSREKSLSVRFMVTGNARVSGGVSEWEVESTYIFSPLTGLIHKQVINSIHPAPHQAVYDSLSKLLGFSWSSGSGNVGKGPAPGTMCKARRN